jgi:endonuclease/exonuclease/phosphatase family metal-dependent hydrolase/phosphatidylglycerophosphate synthase
VGHQRKPVPSVEYARSQLRRIKGPVIWLAHALTVSRIGFAVAFWLTYGAPVWSIAWVSLAAVSDALDGRVARAVRRHAGVPEDARGAGSWLDPAADKLFVMIAIAAIGAHDRGAWTLIACIAARELVMIPLTVAYGVARAFGRVRAIELRARGIGKAATVVQFLAVVALVAPGTALLAMRWPLAIVAGGLGLAAAVEQTARALARPAAASAAHPRATPVPTTADQTISHRLAPHYRALRAIRTRRKLETSALWAEIGSEVERVVGAIERRDRREATPLTGSFRAVAWNIKRGAELDALRDAMISNPELSRADVLLLSEVDVGMGRSGNRNVPRELADALGMSYAFAVSYLALEDDHLENPDRLENTLALAGSAILSRAPILRVVSADLPALRDKFASSEKRLGRKRAVVAEIATAGAPIVIAQAHLDSTASSSQRARQLASVIDSADALGASRLLLGGDLNTTTYDASSTPALARDILHKLVITGFDRTIDNYMTPELRYECPVFELLAARKLSIDGFNDRSLGTLCYDFSEPYTLAKLRDAVGGLLARWLVRRLRSRNGLVEARLDWFAGRGLVPLGARVERPRPGGQRASDHDPIVVDVAL